MSQRKVRGRRRQQSDRQSRNSDRFPVLLLLFCFWRNREVKKNGKVLDAPNAIALRLGHEIAPSAATYEQDVGGVDLQEFLLQLLAAAQRRRASRSCLP